MTPDTIFFILAIIFIAIAAIFTANIVLGYNLTKQDIQDERILAICIETDIKLDYCHDIYGKIGTDYGEPKPLK